MLNLASLCQDVNLASAFRFELASQMYCVELASRKKVATVAHAFQVYISYIRDHVELSKFRNVGVMPGMLGVMPVNLASGLCTGFVLQCCFALTIQVCATRVMPENVILGDLNLVGFLWGR